MPSYASSSASAKKSVAVLKTVKKSPVLLASFCVIQLKSSGVVVPGISLMSKDKTGKDARQRAKLTLARLHGDQSKTGLGSGVVQVEHGSSGCGREPPPHD